MKLYVFPSDEGVVFDDLNSKTAPPSDVLESRISRTAVVGLMWTIGAGIGLLVLLAG